MRRVGLNLIVNAISTITIEPSGLMPSCIDFTITVPASRKNLVIISTVNLSKAAYIQSVLAAALMDPTYNEVSVSCSKLADTAGSRENLSAEAPLHRCLSTEAPPYRHLYTNLPRTKTTPRHWAAQATLPATPGLNMYPTKDLLLSPSIE
jgi:hypothetical protein